MGEPGGRFGVSSSGSVSTVDVCSAGWTDFLTCPDAVRLSAEDAGAADFFVLTEKKIITRLQETRMKEEIPGSDD
jgi:hypothetical protein